jgi:outer membrane protein insertion porin family
MVLSGDLMKQHIGIVLGALLLAAVGANAKILDTLTIEGLVVHQPSVVRNSITLREKAEFTPADIQMAIKSLYKTGLFRIVDFFVTREADSSASLLLRVTEYPVCEVIEFSGNKKLKPKDFEEKMTLKKGMELSDALLFDNVIIIRNLYDKKGYLLVDIKTDIIPTKIPGNVLVKFKINDGPKVVVRKITFTGNAAIKEGKLKAKFKTKEKKLFWGGDFDADQYKNNLDSLILYYNDLGYIDARVARDSIWYGENKKDISIQIDLSEGKKYVTGDFFFSGNKVIETATLSATILMKKGKPFIKSKFEATKEYVINAYREEGYLWVLVRDQLSYRGDTVDVTFDITEGRPAIVRKIDITGNVKTHEKVVRREMAIMPGQKYKQSAMMRSVRDIYQLNFFSNVKPDLHPNEDGTVDLLFSITEKDNIGQLSLGASYSALEQFMGTFTTSIPNFRGQGQRLDLSMQIGKYSQDVSIGFTEPWAFNTPTSLYGRIYYSKYSYYYNREAYGFTGTASRRLKWPDDYFSASVGYTLEWARDYNIEDTLFPNNVKLQPRGVDSKLSFSLWRDDTDMPKFPSSGSRFSISPDIAGLGGDYQFLKTTVAYDYYFPLFWKFVLAAKTKYAQLNSIMPNGHMNISRYDALRGGGVMITDGIIRGYDDESFGGPYNPQNGVALLALTSELQFPILEQTLYFSVFGDMGNTWPRVADVNLNDLYPGAGVGIRLDIPMLGLLGFDLGYGFRKQNNYNNHFGSEGNGWKPHFQMGRGF